MMSKIIYLYKKFLSLLYKYERKFLLSLPYKYDKGNNLFFWVKGHFCHESIAKGAPSTRKFFGYQICLGSFEKVSNLPKSNRSPHRLLKCEVTCHVITCGMPPHQSKVSFLP